MKYFDHIATSYDSVRGLEILPSVIKSVGSAAPSGSTIVDIATGTGLFSVPLAKEGYQVIGIDANPSMLEEARRKAEALGVAYTAKLGTAENIPVPDNFADVVLSTNAIHHFIINAHFKEVQRVLKPGGVYIIFTRFAHQNARSLWGQLFPGFAEKEDRLYTPEDFIHIDNQFKELELESLEQIRFQKPFSRARILDTAERRKYSTFALYSEAEFTKALKVFKDRIESWAQETYTAEIGKLVFRLH